MWLRHTKYTLRCVGIYFISHCVYAIFHNVFIRYFTFCEAKYFIFVGVGAHDAPLQSKIKHYSAKWLYIIYSSVTYRCHLLSQEKAYLYPSFNSWSIKSEISCFAKYYCWKLNIRKPSLVREGGWAERSRMSRLRYELSQNKIRRHYVRTNSAKLNITIRSIS